MENGTQGANSIKMEINGHAESKKNGVAVDETPAAAAKGGAALQFRAPPEDGKLYPRFDPDIWLRDCTIEVPEPMEAQVTGEIPAWLSGSLLRNGPGTLKVGDMSYNHVFDGPALMHRYAVKDGRVTYQCRYLQSRSYLESKAAQRIVYTEFGTASVPDPCHTIFDRMATIFKPANYNISDNAVVSFYPLGDQIYAFTETPVLFRIDTQTLETKDRTDLYEHKLVIVNHSAHPHVMPNGDVYNVGITARNGQVKFIVVKFPKTTKGDMFERAEVVAEMKPRATLRPSYMHSFGMTPKYWILLEQPLMISIPAVFKNKLGNKPFHSALKWEENEETHIVVLSRETGKEVARFTTPTLFFFHIINAFESRGPPQPEGAQKTEWRTEKGLGEEIDEQVVLEVCSFKDPHIMETMFVNALKESQTNKDYATWYTGRPVRLRLPMSRGRQATAHQTAYKVQAEVIVDIGVDMPRINYELCNGLPYRYCYFFRIDVDDMWHSALVKVDRETGQTWQWWEEDCFPSEPVFVPRTPGAGTEDDGVVLALAVWGRQARRSALLVLDARDMSEIARAEVTTPGEAVRSFHGWFVHGDGA